MRKGKLRTAKGSFLKAAIVASMLATWISIPFLTNSVSADALSDVRINATLTGPAINGSTPYGNAQYRLDEDGRRRLRVEGFPINLPEGTILEIKVNNATFVTTTVSQWGHFWVERDTENGQTVPPVSVGMPVEVLNGSTVIMTGVFGTVTPTPSPSGTPFPSPSPSGTPNGTPSPSPSGTPNGTPSPSPSVSPTGTPTGTPSPSPSPSGTPNGTPSPSPSVSPSPSPSPGNSGNLFAGLSGPTLNGVVPTGFGEYEIHSSRVELEVRVDRVALPQGTALVVVVDGTQAGTMFLEDDGEARLRLRSDNGQTVPNVVSGSTIAVRNGGSTILTGTFMGFTATPSPSPSPSGTPNGTPSPSPSGTPGATPSPSPSPSPSASPSPSPSFGRFFESHLNGNGMTPPVTTAANGEFKVQLSLDETQATLFGEFHNLSSNQTGARIETGIGTTIVIRDLGVVGGLNGNFATVTFAVTPVQVQMLRANLWTAVITSVNNPNGEIRGIFRQQSNESDFNGDGSHDLAVFRPATGSWYVQNPQGFMSIEFGGANDRIVSGDYDGDGKTDAAMFRDVNGQGVWEIKRSSDGGITTTQFGFGSDTPVRGDFDGDGRLDLAVFRTSTGVWYIQKSNGSGTIARQFGISSDKPMVADMDGDGKDDIAVFRSADGIWYWLRSSDGQFAGRQWGTSGDMPVAGDFDGDGKSDLTVFRPSNGIWYTYLTTTGGYKATQFGVSSDIPVAGNYDADGKMDIAVFRPSDGNWYILRSADNSFQMFQFGLAGDVPLMAR